MTTDNHNQISAMLHVQTGAPDSSVTAEASLGTGHPVQELDEKAAKALQYLVLGGEDLVQALEVRLDSMQEAFMEMLNRQLAELCRRPEDLLHLYLSPEGKLVVEGKANDTDMLCEIIAHKPLLQRRFQEMAQVAMLSHGVEVAAQAHHSLSSLEDGRENPLLGRFHMCLKGPLSHFYVR